MVDRCCLWDIYCVLLFYCVLKHVSMFHHHHLYLCHNHVLVWSLSPLSSLPPLPTWSSNVSLNKKVWQLTELRILKKKRFKKFFCERKWRTKISSTSPSSALQCFLSESLWTFPSPFIPRKPFIKEFLSLSQEIRRSTNHWDHIIDIQYKTESYVHSIRCSSDFLN